ncbi:MAG: molybdopterin-dependent oxidoreductase, partial [Gemmatimonadales bacterium]
MGIIKTTCPMDCPDTCTLDVHVRDGRVTEIRGAVDGALTNGFICTKVAKFGRRQYHKDRLLTPLRRVGPKGSGRFEPIDWDSAVDLISGEFKMRAREHGAESIVPYSYGGSNGFLTDGFVDQAYFARLGASRIAKTLCAAPSGAAATGMYGKMPGVAFQDYVHTDFITVWGANPKVSNIHLVPFLKQAKRNGAFVAAVDPVQNFSSAEIDLHIPVYPGTDLALALTLIRLWRDWGALDDEFLRANTRNLDAILVACEEWPLKRGADVSRVPEESIGLLAREWAARSPAVVRCGWGAERNRNGGGALAALMAIPALLGKFGVRGGGYTMSNSGAATFDRESLGVTEGASRVLNMTRLARILLELDDPRAMALFVYNCNPVATAPDQNRIIKGLEREDLFTVVFDQVMTDTAKFADIVLPAATFLEGYDVKGAYGNYVVGGTVPAVEPEGEARTNPDVFRALANAMGWTEPPFDLDVRDQFDAVASRVTLAGGTAATERLATGGTAAHDFPGLPVQFETVFPRTDDGKIDLA